MKRIVPNQIPQSERTPIVVDPPVSDINISRLMDDGLLVLYREIKNLKILSIHGKLLPEHARDLRDHLKILFELKAREQELLKGKTDEQIQEEAQAVLNESK
jgi:hypothetical protein